MNGSCTTISGHFLAICMFIFHKTEIQTVILRCLTIINLNCYKSYDTKHKNAKNAKNTNACFCTKLQKKQKWKYLHFVSYCLNKLGFRSVKHLKLIVWISVLWKINLHMAKKWPERVLKLSFLSNIHFRSPAFSRAKIRLILTPILTRLKHF